MLPSNFPLVVQYEAEREGGGSFCWDLAKKKFENIIQYDFMFFKLLCPSPF